MPPPLRLLVAFVAAVLLGWLAPAWAAPTQTLRLENGLRVHLTPLDSRGPHLDLRLVVHLGAAHEVAGQRGWAHLVEHMAFNGTERFGAEQIRDLYHREGMRLGREVNASTGERHTVYRLSAPRGDAALLRRNLELMTDWMSAMHFDGDDLAREKRIVAAEALQAEGHERRPSHWSESLLQLPQTRVEAIGVQAEVEAATPAALADFWRRGYRPERAELLLSGDFDAAAVATAIRETLGRLPPRAADAAANTATESTQPPLPVALPALGVRHPQAPPLAALALLEADGEAARHARLALLAVQLRLERGGDITCTRLRHGERALGAGRQLVFLQGESDPGVERRCLARLASAAAAVRAHGVDATGARQMAQRLRREHRRAREREGESRVRAVADGLQAQLLAGARPSTAAARLRQLGAALARQPLHELDAAVRAALRQPRVSLVLRSREQRALAPELLSLWRGNTERGEAAPGVATPAPRYKPAEPFAQPPQRVENPGPHQRSLHYANGAQVHLLRTDNRHGELALLSARDGGLLALPVSQVMAAAQLPQALPRHGLPGNSPAQVRAGLRAGEVELNWFVENFRQGLRARGPARSAALLFSLLHQAHAPAERLPAPAIVTTNTALSGRADLDRVILRTLYELGDPAPSGAAAAVGTSSFDAARTRLFRGATGLQIYVAGDVDLDALQRLADRFVGGLAPSPAAAPVAGLSAGAKRRRLVHRGNPGERADMSFIYVQSADNALERRDAELLLLREVLEQRLWQVLRQRDGLGYEVDLQLRRRAFRRGGSGYEIALVCDPRMVPQVRAGVDEVLLSLVQRGVDEAELAPLRARLAADYRALLRDNASLLEEWQSQRERGRSLRQTRRTAAQIEALGSEQLLAFARQFFRHSGLLEVNVVPGHGVPAGDRAAYVRELP